MKVMRIIISLVIICLSLTDVTGQDNELEDIIRTCLNSYVKENREGINRATMKNRFYFSVANFPPHFNLEDTIQGIHIKYLDNRSAYKKDLKKGGSITILSLKLEGNKLIIAFNDYTAKFKKKRLNLRFYESTIFIYEYSCEKQQWLFIKTELNGI